MAECPYLYYNKSSCGGCRGWRCNAFGVRGVGDAEYCKTQFAECLRYLKRNPPDLVKVSQPVQTRCEYLGEKPPDVKDWRMDWCYARNKGIKLVKGCAGWRLCKYRAEALRKGVKSHVE